MDIGKIQVVDIDKEMRTAYLDYAMSVIVARALPDARDGLKPVHRRILFAMHDMGIRANTSFKKSARIVGEVLGKYHPHGDLAVYEAMARMAQDFSMRYMLVDGQGNFGSIDGDSPAAMRYTEARLSSMAEEMLADINKNTIDFTDNFDGSLQEPLVLPARLPNLLLNGSSGIAVGMATNIPPHNLRELVAAIEYVIDHFDAIEEVTTDDLMKFLPGPDFPTAGMIVGQDPIRQAYSTGRGRLVVRGKAEIEEFKSGRHAIIITEIPYQVNKTSMIERIAALVREDRLDMISDLRDESDRKGMRIVIELKRGAHPQRVLNQLFKYTQLQSTFGVNMLALVDGQPRSLPLRRMLQIYIEHRQQVITRRTQFDLDKAKARAHILDGLLIALNNLDAVIQTIRQAPDAEIAKERLISKFSLSSLQAQAILDMQLRRLAALERQKIEDEYKEIMATIGHLEDLLANPHKILLLIKTDLKEVAAKYGDDRRTVVSLDAREEFSEAELVKDEAVLITVTAKGYIKRTRASLYRTQARGGRGVIGQAMRVEDEVMLLVPARTLNTVLFFSDRGKVYSEKVYNLPDAGRADKGASIMNVLALNAGEKITAALPVPNFEQAKYCTMATQRGRIKRVQLSEFSAVRPSGLIAMSLHDDDMLGWVRLTSGQDEVILVTAMGRALRMDENEIRCMGRPAGGVTGIRMVSKDRVTGMDVVEPDAELLVITDLGYGKRTPLGQYVPKSRGSKGVSTIDKHNLDKIGLVSAARVVKPEDEISMISTNGVIIRMKVKDISVMGRATRGVRVMDMQDGDSVASMARISADILASSEGEEPEPPPTVLSEAPLTVEVEPLLDVLEEDFEEFDDTEDDEEDDPEENEESED
ncbi:MAG: DNA gyrase subunit A [Chloroflexi bacterium HGW-Chloroflexi-10]|nr:MAG: DNA gyrase subunit A [Chloroflexi bacterium HGW-Chloroflexi-10]